MGICREHIRGELLKRWSIDFLRKAGRKGIGPAVGLFAMALLKVGLVSHALKAAMWAHRISYSFKALRVVKELFLDPKRIEPMIMRLVSKPPSLEEVAGRMLVIRWPLIREETVVSKGIIVITYTQNFAFFLKKIYLSIFEKYFYVVLEPSSSGYLDPDILSWGSLTSGPIFVQASEILDRASIAALNANFVSLSIGASDWVDYRIFSPLEVRKIYDSAYIANTTRIKRIHKYLESIAEIKARGFSAYRGALVCASWGGRLDEVAKLCEYYKVNDMCDVFFDLDQKSLREILCKSKVNILLTMKEGSNRSLFEGIFCNTAALCLVDNFGVNKAYINEFTGILTWEHQLTEALLFMERNWERYRPRDWAMENIAPEKSTEKLCRAIAYCANDASLIEDISNGTAALIKVNRPEIQYLDFPTFDKIEFNSKLLETFLVGNDSSGIGKKVTELRNLFEIKVGFRG